MATRQRIKRTIPDNIKDLNGYPLYILVAHWGFRLNKSNKSLGYQGYTH